MQNNLETLNETLFETLNAIKNDQIELKKANAIVGVSQAIIKNVTLQMSAYKFLGNQIEAPKSITEKKVFLKISSNDGHTKKSEFAKSLGYDNVVEAIGALGSVKFNQKFKEEYK